LKNAIKHSSLQSSPLNTEAKQKTETNADYKNKGRNVITLKSGNLSMKGHINPASKIKNKGHKI